MGARNLLVLDTQSNMFLRVGGRNLLNVVCSFWVLLCDLFLFTLRYVGTYILSRIPHAEFYGSDGKEKSCHFYEAEHENRETPGGVNEAVADGNCEEDDHCGCSGDGEGSVLLQASSSKYEFSFGRSHIRGFVEDPKALSFTIQELFVSQIDSGEAVISCEKVKDFTEETELLDHSDDDNAHVKEEEGADLRDHHIAEEAVATSSKNGVAVAVEEEGYGEGRVFMENSSRRIEQELESVNSNDDMFERNVDKVDPFADEVVVEADSMVDPSTNKRFISGSFWDFAETILEDVEEKSDSEESYAWDDDLPNPEVACSIEDKHDQSGYQKDQSGVMHDDDDQCMEMEMQGEVLSVGNDRGTKECEREESGQRERHGEISNGEDDPDSMWEHDEIIEQLKLELKAAKTGGLPTILEESETEKESVSSPPPKMTDDLMKPLKVSDQKLEHKDRIMEIQKVYKSYAERMRKLDVLNYQTMHAIGLVHLTDPLRLNTTQRPSSPMIKSLLSQNLLPVKLWKNKIGPTAKSMEAYYGDLEMVYVGQVCLSWEILQWQYGKSRELLESDPHRSCQYNTVAAEFQLFQVLLLRFIENEPFQGPRIENYVKNRCVVRSLLHVPALRDDSFGEKKAKVGAQDAVPHAALTEIIEESIRLFWDFVRFDKEEGDAIHKACKKTQFNILDAADLELLIATKTHLQKKEKKLKDIVRSGNCIVKRFQKHRNMADQVLLLVLAQVEVRLISRVLNMAKVTRDQVLWCREKLGRINFVSRKIYVEPSFLLFPC